MNNTPTDPTDLVGLLVALIATIASPELARLVGPYMAIFIVSCAGAAFSASGTNSKMAAWSAARYIFIRVFVALAVTVTVAEAVQAMWPAFRPRVTLIPLAFVIGCIGDFNKVRDWAAAKFDRILTRKIDGDSK